MDNIFSAISELLYMQGLLRDNLDTLCYFGNVQFLNGDYNQAATTLQRVWKFIIYLFILIVIHCQTNNRHCAFDMVHTFMFCF